MRYLLPFCALLFLLAGCKKELEFETKTFEKKTSVACKGVCPHVVLKLPIAQSNSVVADSINKKVFSVMKEIIYFGEKPYKATDYNALIADFIASYEKLQRENPDDVIGWEGEITGRVAYESEKIIDIEIQHYTFTGGAHGYSGKRSLIFDKETGKEIRTKALFKNLKAFKKFAEEKFREQYKIPPKAPINVGGLMFEDNKFELPETVFFTEKGLLLYYNSYEIASYADGPQELLLPFSKVDEFLAIK